MYKRGDGVEKDIKQAVEWWRKAAEQGDASGQYNLGLCYYNGEGGRKDIITATYYFTKAAAQGHEDAKKKLNPFK